MPYMLFRIDTNLFFPQLTLSETTSAEYVSAGCHREPTSIGEQCSALVAYKPILYHKVDRLTARTR